MPWPPVRRPVIRVPPEGALDAAAIISLPELSLTKYRRRRSPSTGSSGGARPGALPVEQPTRFELAARLATAKMLGLTIPPSLLLRTQHVVRP
jgi:hypothetical protein